MPLTQEERRTLLRLARRAIELHSETGVLLQPLDLGLDVISPALDELRGAFVTLEAQGELRGCIGMVRPREPLWKAVADCAVLAAYEDPRFPPVTEKEIPSLQVEVTVLDPLEPIQGPEDVQIGSHGLLIETESQRGVLLPQVATERGWDAETFLQETCRKAGLHRDLWRRPECEIHRFGAEHFSERSEAEQGSA